MAFYKTFSVLALAVSVTTVCLAGPRPNLPETSEKPSFEVGKRFRVKQMISFSYTSPVRNVSGYHASCTIHGSEQLSPNDVLVIEENQLLNPEEVVVRDFGLPSPTVTILKKISTEGLYRLRCYLIPLREKARENSQTEFIAAPFNALTLQSLVEVLEPTDQ